MGTKLRSTHFIIAIPRERLGGEDEPEVLAATSQELAIQEGEPAFANNLKGGGAGGNKDTGRGSLW